MTTTASTSSSRYETTPATPPGDARPGPEVVARALPFETIPAGRLRDHFTEWLTGFIASQQRTATPDLPAPYPPKAVGVTRHRSGAPPCKATNPAAPTTEPHASQDQQGAGTSPAKTPQIASADPPVSQHQPDAPLHLATDQPAAEIGTLASRERSSPPPGRTGRTRARPPASRPARGPDLPDRERPPAAGPPAATGAEPWRDQEAPPRPRPQYVRFGDRSVWLTKPMLRSRGWTEAAIRDHLPEPEALKPNPRFAVSGAPMPVWRPATVAAAEAAPEWKDWLERSLHRRKTTLKALGTSDDQEFQHRLFLADKEIRACTEPPTLPEPQEEAQPQT